MSFIKVFLVVVFSFFYFSIACVLKQDLVEIVQNFIPNGSGYNLKYITDFFYENNCTLYIHGGATRDIVWNILPRDIDVDYDCSIKDFTNVCKKLWVNCTTSSTGYFKITGYNLNEESELEELEGIPTNEFNNKPLYQFEFTLNSNKIDTSNYTWKLTYLKQQWLNDLCNGVIALPNDDFNLWLYGFNSDFNSMQKLVRYFKLPPKGFYSTNQEMYVNLIKNGQFDNQICRILCLTNQQFWNKTTNSCYSEIKSSTLKNEIDKYYNNYKCNDERIDKTTDFKGEDRKKLTRIFNMNISLIVLLCLSICFSFFIFIKMKKNKYIFN